MLKKFAALSAGMAMLAMATIVPVMAQATESDTSDVNVDVNDFLTFAIGNIAGNCAVAAGGDCPFGSGAGANQLTSLGSYDFSFADATTQLVATTNSADGYNVLAFADDTDTRTDALLRSGGDAGTAADLIEDTVQVLQPTQGDNAPLAKTGPGDFTDTGLAFRVTNASTSAILREADEDSQWGTTDDDEETLTAQALWASLPLGAGVIAYDTDTYSSGSTTAFINWFVGIASTQQTGTYNGTVTFTAAVN